MAGRDRIHHPVPRRASDLAGWVGCELLATCLAAGAVTPSTQAYGKYLLKSWHTEDGLPDGNITAIAETPDGYLWIGTFGGSARFDGVRFTVFDRRRAPSLAGRRITGLLADRAGRLWVAGEGGAIFWYEQGRFGRPNGAPMVGGDEPAVVRSTHSRWLRPTDLAEDLEGGIWMWAPGGVWSKVWPASAREDARGNEFPSGRPAWLVPDSGRKPWALASDVVWQCEGGTWVERWTIPGLALGAPVFHAAREGGLWVAAPRGSWAGGGGRILRLRDGKARADLPPTPWATNSPRSQVTALLEDRAGRLWLGTHWGGVSRLDRGAWRPPVDEGVLAQSRVNCLFEDHRGGIWIGTLGDGLHRLTRRPVTVLRLPPPAMDHMINTVCATRAGDVWVGTDGAGTFRYRDGVFAHFGQAEGLGNDLVMTFCEDAATILWCGTAGGLFQQRAGRFERVSVPEANLGPASRRHPRQRPRLRPGRGGGQTQRPGLHARAAPGGRRRVRLPQRIPRRHLGAAALAAGADRLRLRWKSEVRSPK